MINMRATTVGINTDGELKNSLESRIKNFIESFDLQLVHIHVNNWGFVTPNRFPQNLELTFSPKQFNKKITNESKKFPISLDQPNNPLFHDYPIV